LKNYFKAFLDQAPAPPLEEERTTECTESTNTALPVCQIEESAAVVVPSKSLRLLFLLLSGLQPQKPPSCWFSWVRSKLQSMELGGWLIGVAVAKFKMNASRQ
jgi:hypothetical protein